MLQHSEHVLELDRRLALLDPRQKGAIDADGVSRFLMGESDDATTLGDGAAEIVGTVERKRRARIVTTPLTEQMC